MQLDKTTLDVIRRFQKAEATCSVIYARMARYEKHDKHAATLNQIAVDEQQHCEIWENYTGEVIAHNRVLTTWYTLLFFVCGYTFVLRLLEKGETKAARDYSALPEALPEIQSLIEEEQNHEAMLISILDEERLKYVGAIVLGLNDALVELTGSIAGFSIALANTQVIAMAGIITGVAATLSMAASNFLAEKENDNPNALKASLYTGAAYLVTVVVLIIPFILFPGHMYVEALVTMLVFVILIILVFNYYISVAQSQPFWSRFGRMAGISLGVAVISFFIGQLAKVVLGVDI